MKIAFIVDLFPQLSETFILNQITGLIDRGHEVDIFARSQGTIHKVHDDVIKYNLIDRTFYFNSPPANKIRRYINGLGFIASHILNQPLPILKSLNVFQYRKEAASFDLQYKIVPFFNKGSYDIVHCHFGPNGNLGVFLRKIDVIKSKIITSFHGYDINRYPQLHGKDIYSELFEKADLLTVNSNFTGNKIKALGCSENKITKLPVGLDTTHFNFNERKLKPIDNIRILTVARLVEKKGITYSIKAVARTLKKYPNIRYKIVGDGRLHDELLDLIKQLSVENEVELVGWKNHDEIKQFYSEAHIFILSSVTTDNGNCEGQGLVLQEAQAMGLPVIATIHNGFPESIIDGSSGFLVPEKDVDAIVEQLYYLIENSEKWTSMGHCGRKFVEENFDINNLNDRLVEIYQGLLN